MIAYRSPMLRTLLFIALIFLCMRKDFCFHRLFIHLFIFCGRNFLFSGCDMHWTNNMYHTKEDIYIKVMPVCWIGFVGVEWGGREGEGLWGVGLGGRLYIGVWMVEILKVWTSQSWKPESGIGRTAHLKQSLLTQLSN